MLAKSLEDDAVRRARVKLVRRRASHQRKHPPKKILTAKAKSLRIRRINSTQEALLKRSKKKEKIKWRMATPMKTRRSIRKAG